MTAEELRKEIEAFLHAHHVVSLASVDERNQPHAANVFFALDGLSLIWTSSADTRHSKHLETGARVAATIAPDYTDFTQVRGLQLFGSARRLADPEEAARAREILCQRYSFLQQLASGPLRAALDAAGFYRMQPETITFIDNTKGFGHKDTLAVAANGSFSMVENF